LQFLFSVHDDGAVPGDRLLEGLARNQKEPDPLLTRLHGNLIAAVEKDERAIAGAIADQGLAAIDGFLGERAEGPGEICETQLGRKGPFILPPT
jgi:hypothetical protein